MTNKEIIESFNKEKESLNLILDELQNKNGFVSQKDIQEIANYIGMTGKEIMILLKYKKNIKMEKQGKNIVIVCKGPNCLKKGSLDIIKAIEKEFNVKEGHTSKDGKITLDTKKCFKKMWICTKCRNQWKII